MNAVHDAPRHTSAPHRQSKIGRRASRTALPLGARSRRRLIRRAVFGAFTGPFASKLAPTGSACGRRSAD
ncbi:hypothetical protein CXB35_25610 [Pseudomonas syringae]|nr:hypothetical protein CXB35_25610 [Pseudomonas syringae]